MSTRVETINRGLALLGVEAIGGFDELSATGDIVRRIYPVTYKSVLSKYRWTACKTQAGPLAKLPTETPEEYERYQLPNDFLAMERVFEGGQGTEIPHEINKNVLTVYEDVSTTNGLYLQYIAGVDEGVLPEYLIDYLSAQFAHDACMALTQDQTLTDRMRQISAEKGREARMTDWQSTGSRQLGGRGTYEYSMLQGRRV